MSLFSDATIMSAAAVGTDVISFYKAQMPYTLSAIISSLIIFLILGFSQYIINSFYRIFLLYCFIIITNYIILQCIHYLFKNK